jgi:putative acetyltransferase
MDALTLSVEDPATPDVRALLQRHFDLMRSQSPAESCHVMAPDTLTAAGAVLLGVRRDGMLLGVGALARVGPSEGELKSMHTASEARGQGVARQLLQALILRAQDMGLTRISLETGTAAPFAAARSLYAAEGFVECPPFGSYVRDSLSVFMTKQIASPAP